MMNSLLMNLESLLKLLKEFSMCNYKLISSSFEIISHLKSSIMGFL
jgi:hypothetical protein